MLYSENVFLSHRVPGDKLQYVKYVPAENHDGKLPLVIYIHGAGGRGDNISIIRTIGAMAEFANGRELGAICVAPQCHAHTWFDIYDLLLEFLQTMICDEKVDADRVYITGSSMGAYTTWQLLMSHPEWFAAAVPVCGGGMYWNATQVAQIPLWVTHGALDEVVLPEESLKMVKAVNKNGGNAKITIYPDCDHAAWIPTFSNDEVWKWMFTQKKR